MLAQTSHLFREVSAEFKGRCFRCSSPVALIFATHGLARATKRTVRHVHRVLALALRAGNSTRLSWLSRDALNNIRIFKFKLMTSHMDQRCFAVLLAESVIVTNFCPFCWSCSFSLPLKVANRLAGYRVNVLKVAAQVSTLCEGFETFRTCEGTLSSVLSEMISKVTALFENRTATWMTTAEVKFNPQRFRVSHLDGLMPRVRNSVKCLWLDSGTPP
jgi:hypothetical protein